MQVFGALMNRKKGKTFNSILLRQNAKPEIALRNHLDSKITVIVNLHCV